MQLTNELLMRLHREEITFNAFARLTRGDFMALATSMMKKRPVAPCIDVDDVVQEMLLTTFKHVPRWQPGRATIKSYIVFTICSAAGDYLNRTVLQKKRDILVEPESKHTLPTFEFRCDAGHALQVLPMGERQAAILRSVAETQCIDRTTDELMSDPHTRTLFAADRTSVRRGVYRTVETLTQRAQALA